MHKDGLRHHLPEAEFDSRVSRVRRTWSMIIFRFFLTPDAAELFLSVQINVDSSEGCYAYGHEAVPQQGLFSPHDKTMAMARTI